MNANASVFTPQGTGGDKPTGSSRSSLSASLSSEGKKSNQRAPQTQNHSKAFPAEQQQQRSLPGRGKNQRQSNSKRSAHEREQGRVSNNAVRSSTSSSSTDSLAVSLGQLSTVEKGSRGNTKKNQVSLNHLLNFSFPVREEPQLMGPIRRRRNVNYQPYNKEKFINANFRFLLSPRRDYEVYMMDADAPVEWADIEQVLISVPQSCPICLQTPVAGRITKCGHVYCFPCILHYLALSETSKAWRKCPICWDAVYEKDLKSSRTVHEEHDLYDQGEKEIAKQIASKQEVTLEMRLIQRSLSSTMALPRSKTFPLKGGILPEKLNGQPPLEFYPDAMTFSRLMITTLDRIESELDRDIQSIEFSMEESRSYDPNAHSEELVFFEMALSKIKESKEKIKEEAKFFPKASKDREHILRKYFDQQLKESDSDAENESAAVTPTRTITYVNSGPEAYQLARQEHMAVPTLDMSAVDLPAETTVSAGSDTTPAPVPAPAPASAPLQGRSRPANQVTTMFYFYQAANGHHLYLQPLDIRILKQHFDLYEKFPEQITVKVLGIEETSLTEEVRKKCKYLGHLPLGCEVSFLDVALEGVVGEEGVKPFETELKLRRSKRLEKEAREERERIAREYKLNPPKPIREDIFSNDPFFQHPLSASSLSFNSNQSSSSTAGPSTRLGERSDSLSDVELQEALRLSAQAELDELPTLSEAHARLSRRPSVPKSSSTSSREIPGAGNQDSKHSTSLANAREHWGGSSVDSNTSSSHHAGPSTVWGTPSVPVSRHYDDYDDYYDDDELDYEPDVVVKRGKKKVAVLMSNNSRRTR